MTSCRNQCLVSRRRRRRAGAVTLELILNLPIWLILFLATLEFGQLNCNLQQLSLASRVGAKEASESITGAEVNTPAALVDAVTRQLQTAGVLGSGSTPCDVIVEHNLAGPRVELHAAGASCSCSPPDTSLLPSGVTYTRVTVCVPCTAVAPNLLATYGLNMSSRLVQSSTTYAWETP